MRRGVGSPANRAYSVRSWSFGVGMVSRSGSILTLSRRSVWDPLHDPCLPLDSTWLFPSLLMCSGSPQRNLQEHQTRLSSPLCLELFPRQIIHTPMRTRVRVWLNIICCIYLPVQVRVREKNTKWLLASPSDCVCVQVCVCVCARACVCVLTHLYLFVAVVGDERRLEGLTSI